MVSFIYALTQAGVVLVAPTITQARGGAPTLVTCTIEQVAVVVHTLKALPVGGGQHIVVAKPVDEPTMTDEKNKRFKRFQKLHPPHFYGVAS